MSNPNTSTPQAAGTHVANHSSKISLGECTGSASTSSGHSSSQGMHIEPAYVVLAIAVGCLFLRNKSFRIIAGVVAVLAAVNIGLHKMFAC